MQSLSPALGDGPDLLTLWHPAAHRQPRVAGTSARAATLNRELTQAADALAQQHQPVNLAEHASARAPNSTSVETNETETFPLQTASAPPGFLARAQIVRLEELLTLTPLEQMAGSEPMPGSLS